MKNSAYKLTIITCYIGTFVKSIILNITPILFIPLIKNFNLSHDNLSMFALVNFLTQIVSIIIFTKPIIKYGLKLFACISHVLCFIGLLLFAFTPQLFKSHELIGFLFSIIIFSIAAGLLQITLTPIIHSIDSNHKPGSISILYSFYAFGQIILILITTMFLLYFGQENWIFVPLFWSIIPFINLFIFLKSPVNQEHYKNKIMTLKELFKVNIFISGFIALIFGAASEITINQWISTFFEKGLLNTKTFSDIAGVCIFALFLGIGRLMYGFFGKNFNLNKLLISGSLLSAFCYIIQSLSHNNILSIACSGLCGFFVSLLWPGTIGFLAKVFSSGGITLFSILAVAGNIGSSFSPFIFGESVKLLKHSELTENLSIRICLFLAFIFPLIAFIEHSRLKKISKNKKRS